MNVQYDAPTQTATPVQMTLLRSKDRLRLHRSGLARSWLDSRITVSHGAGDDE